MTNPQKKISRIALKVINVFLLVMVLTFTVSCEDNEISDFEDQLIEPNDPIEDPNDDDDPDDGDQDDGDPDDGDPDDDNSNLVTYENTAKNILDTNCIECHNINNAAAGVRLENFANAFNEANNGRMITRMTNPNNPMPPSGMLPDNVIQDIMDWIDDGLLEN